MEDLIEALQVLLKYGNPKYPTNCDHDVMVICGICTKDVSSDDKKRLDELGFFESEEFDGQFASFKFGSA